MTTPAIQQYVLPPQVATARLSGGKASVTLGPQLAREQWFIDTTTVTGLNMTVTVSLDGSVVDSTTADPRPTVTDNTPFHLMAGHILTIAWAVASSGLPDGTVCTATVKGRRQVGGGT